MSKFIKYEGVSLNVDFVKGMTEKKFLANEQMKIAFNGKEAVMQGAYRTITGKGNPEPVVPANADQVASDGNDSPVSE